MTNNVRLNGDKCGPEDPKRGIWYGLCTYWTDDWDAVRAEGIPKCPHCNSVGFQTTAEDWFSGAKRFQAEGNPGYMNFIAQSKEQCKRPLKFMEWFKQWLIEHPNGRDTNPRSGG